MKTGIELIAIERKEQLSKHGRSIDYDANKNSNGEMRYAAKYLLALNNYKPVSEWPSKWDLGYKNYLDTHKTDIEKLVIAGALIAAEIDRLQSLDK